VRRGSNRRQLAERLLAHLGLGSSQASVLVDESETPFALRVFVHDRRAVDRCRAVRVWRGHSVFVEADEPRPHVRGGTV
jgi:hypothetical protein